MKIWHGCLCTEFCGHCLDPDTVDAVDILCPPPTVERCISEWALLKVDALLAVDMDKVVQNVVAVG